jgi:hypothetical protein
MSLTFIKLRLSALFIFFGITHVFSQSVKVSSFGFQNPTNAFYKALESSNDTIVIGYRVG